MNTYIYIHICCINNWKEIFINLYNHILNSGLHKIVDKIKCNVLSNTIEEPFIFLNNLNDNKIEILNICSNLDNYETPTINMLHDNSLYEDFYVLYIHTKGCKYNNSNNNVNDWVEYLIYFNIDNHKKCIEHLMNNYDTVGVNLQNIPVTHYSGNFWWSKSSYLRKLEKCIPDRYNSPEFWLTEKNIGNYVSLWNSNINHYDQRYEKHNYIFENEKYVLVEGDGGLGNCLFQICTAIYYSENYNYNIILNDKSNSLHFGTSNFTNRTRCKIENGKMISYKETIFNKFKYGEFNQCLCKKIYNNYEANKISPTNDDYYLLITGYCQNKDLFKDILPTLTKYLNLYDHKSINILINKYNIDLNKKNIMIGLRICDDFAHMKKITAQSYKKALDLFINENETDYNLIIISDSSDYMKMLGFNIKGTITYIDEDDISQLNIGLLCNYFILSESTYHYWVAVIKNYMDKNTKVICFNDTDLTNRNLALDDWIKIDY